MEGKYIIEVTIKKAEEKAPIVESPGFDFSSLMKYAPAILEIINKANEQKEIKKENKK